MANKKQKPDLFSMPTNHRDDTPIQLSEDAKAASLKAIVAARDSLTFVADFIKNGSLSVSTRFNGFGVAQSNLNEAKKLLGGEDDDRQNRESDLYHLRMANQENQRLREEMAKGVTTEAVAHKLYALHKIVYDWWNKLGFNYSKGHFDGHGHGAYYTVEFSVHLDDMSFSHDPEPVTTKKKKKEKIVSLKDVIDLIYEDGDRSMQHVVDTPKTRAWILNQLKTRFPSIRIVDIRLNPIHKSDLFAFREIKAYIDIDEIEEVDDDVKEG